MARGDRITQYFSDFRGIDLRSSDLSRAQNSAKDIANFEIASSLSLEGAKGIKTVMFGPGAPIVAFHNYISTDPVTGVRSEEMIGLGEWLYRRKTANFTINYTGGDTWYYKIETDGTDFTFYLYDNDVQVLSQTLGTGVEDDTTGVTTLATLEAAIDGVTNFTADSPSTIDTSVATVLPVALTAAAGSGSTDIEVGYWEKVPDYTEEMDESDYGPFRNYMREHDEIARSLPVFANKRNVCYIAVDGYCHLMKYDGVKLMQAGSPQLIKDDQSVGSDTGSPAVVGTYKYYLRCVRRDAKGNFIIGAGTILDAYTTSAGDRPFLSIYANYYWQDFLIGTDDTTQSTTTNVITLNAAIDESEFSEYGLEQLAPGDVIFIAINPFPSGGDIIRTVTAVDRAAKTITVDEDITFGASGDCNVYRNFGQFNIAHVRANGAQANVSTIDTTGKTQENVQVGDWLYFRDPGRWFEVTAVNAASVEIDGVVTVANDESASNCVVEAYRTEDEGTSKYYLSKTVGLPECVYYGILDDTADADLGVEIDVPDALNEPDWLVVYPKTFVIHQGSIVAAGAARYPDRLFIEDPQFIEGFPGNRFFDVNSQEIGVITALWPDTQEQLAVFKDAAYYNVIGSVRDEILSLIDEVVSEGDVGCSAQSALTKARGINFGVCPLGIIAFAGGELNLDFTESLNAYFLDNNVGDTLNENAVLRTNRAVCINDKFKNQVIIVIPAFDQNTVNTSARLGVNNNSRIYVIDYSQNTITRRQFPDALSSPNLVSPFVPNDMIIFEDRLHTLGCTYDSTMSGDAWTKFSSLVFRRKEKERDAATVGDGDYGHDYADQHLAMEFDYKSQWYFADSPSLDKAYQWLKYYCLDDGFSSFTLRLRTYIDWDEDNAIDDISVTIDSSTGRVGYIKLEANAAETMMIRLTTNTLNKGPRITGYELMTNEDYTNTEGAR